MDILTKGGRVSRRSHHDGRGHRLPGVRGMRRRCTSKAASSSASIPKTAGRRGFCVRSEGLSGSLENLGFGSGASRPGTPARAWTCAPIDFDRMEPQPGDDPIVPFSFLTAAGDPDTGVSFPLRKPRPCAT